MTQRAFRQRTREGTHGASRPHSWGLTFLPSLRCLPPGMPLCPSLVTVSPAWPRSHPPLLLAPAGPHLSSATALITPLGVCSLACASRVLCLKSRSVCAPSSGVCHGLPLPTGHSTSCQHVWPTRPQPAFWPHLLAPLILLHSLLPMMVLKHCLF